jgi:hypothetical protein
VGDSAGNLGIVNANTGAVTNIGNFGIGEAMTDIAFDPSGNLWGITFTDLYKINAGTAATTHVGSLGGPSVNSLTFASDGTLYAANTNLYTINTTTGAASAVGALGGSFASSGDLAFHNGALYLTSADIFGPDDLVTVNTSTGAATLVGSMGVPAEFGLVNGPDNVLYGVAGTNVYTVNPATGVATLLSSYAAQGLGQAFGAAVATEAVAPLPSTAAGFAVLMCICVAGRHLKRRGDTLVAKS